MNRHRLIHPCIEESLHEFGYHPAMEFPANNPYNGFRWDSDKGAQIDEPAARMSMATAYATFEPSRSFHTILDDSCARVCPDMREEHNYGDRYWLIHQQGTEVFRDHCLMLMGL